MTQKLSEFRLESYDERMVLMMAMALYQSKYPDMYISAANALAVRLSRTQCQPGGCEYCDDVEGDGK